MSLGKKVEEGSFSELLKIPNGMFKGMWERQQKKEEDVVVVGHDEGRIANAVDAEANGTDIGLGSGGTVLGGAS